jgi:hypothetical protein
LRRLAFNFGPVLSGLLRGLEQLGRVAKLPELLRGSSQLSEA